MAVSVSLSLTSGIIGEDGREERCTSTLMRKIECLRDESNRVSEEALSPMPLIYRRGLGAYNHAKMRSLSQRMAPLFEEGIPDTETHGEGTV